MVLTCGRLHLQRCLEGDQSELAGWVGAASSANESARAPGRVPGSLARAAARNPDDVDMARARRGINRPAAQHVSVRTFDLLDVDAGDASGNSVGGGLCGFDV